MGRLGAMLSTAMECPPLLHGERTTNSYPESSVYRPRPEVSQ